MATFVLIHGAGSDGWYWHLVVPELEARGHDRAGARPALRRRRRRLHRLRPHGGRRRSARRRPTWCWSRSRWPGSPHRSCASRCRSTCSCSSRRWCRGPARAARRVVGRHRGGRRPAPARPIDPVEDFLHDLPTTCARRRWRTLSAGSRARRSSGRTRCRRGPRCRRGSSPARRTGSSRSSSCGASCRSGSASLPTRSTGGHLPALARPSSWPSASTPTGRVTGDVR